MGVQLALVKGRTQLFFIFSAKILQVFVFSLYFLHYQIFCLGYVAGYPLPNHSGA